MTMKSEGSRRLQALVRALIEINRVASPEVKPAEKRSVLASFVTALHNAVECDALWSMAVGGSASPSDGDSSANAEALLLQIAEFLKKAHAKLLRDTGYRVPPPPPVDRLIEQTRQAVLGRGDVELWGTSHVEDARSELAVYVDRVEIALGRQGTTLSNLISSARRLGTVGVLSLLLSHAEFKVGDGLQAEMIFSTKDMVKVEVTLPSVWGEKSVASFRQGIESAHFANLHDVASLSSREMSTIDRLVKSPSAKNIASATSLALERPVMNDSIHDIRADLLVVQLKLQAGRTAALMALSLLEEYVSLLAGVGLSSLDDEEDSMRHSLDTLLAAVEDIGMGEAVVDRILRQF